MPTHPERHRVCDAGTLPALRGVEGYSKRVGHDGGPGRVVAAQVPDGDGWRTRSRRATREVGRGRLRPSVPGFVAARCPVPCSLVSRVSVPAGG